MKIYNTILNEYSKNIKICIRMGDKLFGKEVKMTSFVRRKLDSFAGLKHKNYGNKTFN